MKPVLVVASFGTGSTYFQRAATFWIRELIDPEFTNPHELLNGIAFDNGKLVKRWMSVTAQSLTDIQTLIVQSPNAFLARIAYDHLILRNESPHCLDKFYKFLNDKFDIYISLREDQFDYGLCYAIRRCTHRELQKQINCTHSPKERAQLYEGQQFTVDPQLMLAETVKYAEYKVWATQNFPNANIIDYDEIEENIDQVLMRYFPAEQTIEQKYGLSIADYTQLNYEISKGTGVPTANSQKIDLIINTLCEQQVLLDPIPIKSTTMQDKQSKILNFDECVDLWNNR